MSTENRPEILLLSLAYVDFLDDMYKSLFSNLVESARLKRVKKANVALCYLDANNPKAIIITDQGLTDPRHNEVLQKVQTYIHSGGLAIVGLHFPNFASWDVFDHFFAFGFELPWKAGDYARITRPASCLRVLHVKGARLHERILVPVPDPGTESLGSGQENTEGEIRDEIQAAVTGARLGSGYLVYCGNVNPEEEVDRIILSLCGLQV
ncbi:uncharacterized protein P174DRAFT_474575 [Aspergillus novofumigatus IBT 16806]|uniref:Uncharacterized protein n=1 Tax=Aspergillus novofumigatus (strain IBT 16806) TaxID=1392255 RepID=A0A2I1CFI1_ASPN1|nr:uncharacterized protein P174DRAFT_474575 [Aspergillus novofumigatus IBT 16806]PKX96403.1 hypothetical protein P174DRAFT_474575 [Aspergillus novofumigatus IBT 16806]